uniref:Uncharacterized protein n=1 Tax=Glossina austeni TaxID=7395 RepID=A0A1A9UNT0_GLOAU
MKLFPLFQQQQIHMINERLNNSDSDISLIHKKAEQTLMIVAVVVCGHRTQEMLAMIKTALLVNSNGEKLYFLIFAEKRLMISFNEKLNDCRANRSEFGFRLLPRQFPVNSERE